MPVHTEFDMAAIKPYKHQLKTVKFLAPRPRALDLSDPGTGKTYSEILDFVAARKKGGKCALVIAPKSLLRAAWEEDFKKFAPHIKCSVAEAENRAEAFATDADVYITNTDASVLIFSPSKTRAAWYSTGACADSTATAREGLKTSSAKKTRRVIRLIRSGDSVIIIIQMIV